MKKYMVAVAGIALLLALMAATFTRSYAQPAGDGCGGSGNCGGSAVNDSCGASGPCKNPYTNLPATGRADQENESDTLWLPAGLAVLTISAGTCIRRWSNYPDRV